MTNAPPPPHHADWSLSALLATQVVTLFIAIPVAATHPAAHLLQDAGHLVFAMICATLLASRRSVRIALVVGLALLAAGPVLYRKLFVSLGIDHGDVHEVISFVAFGFNAAVTLLVARHVFGPGRVTAHRVQGAVLIYLNIAALFAILYSALLWHVPGALALTTGGALPLDQGSRSAVLTYFSLSTLTTTGFGDVVPMAPIVRSLANLESVIGQLFPATLLARIVALHLAHQNDAMSGPGA